MKKVYSKKRLAIMIFSSFLVLGLLFFGVNCKFLRCNLSSSHEGKIEHMADMLKKKLDLTDSQKGVVEKMKQELIKKRALNKKEMRSNFQKLIGLVRSDTVDMNVLRRLRMKQSELHKEMGDLMMSKAVELHKILTPEQREKAAKLLEKFHEKRCHDSEH